MLLGVVRDQARQADERALSEHCPLYRGSPTFGPGRPTPFLGHYGLHLDTASPPVLEELSD